MENLKHKFLYIFIILGFTFYLNSCSDDDNEPKTFLEIYDGTKWVDTGDGAKLYLRFKNNLGNFLELWIQDENCYIYGNIFNDSEDVIEIIENTENKFLYKISADDFEGKALITIDGNILKYTASISSNNETDTFTTFYNKTTINIDEFQICDD